jgi:hypothetical protein
MVENGSKTGRFPILTGTHHVIFSIGYAMQQLGYNQS